MSNADKPAFAQSMAFDSEGHGYAAMEKDPSLAGMTKREYFAAKMLAEIIGSVYCGYNEVYQRQLTDWQEKFGDSITVREAMAKDAIELADELLKQLEK